MTIARRSSLIISIHVPREGDDTPTFIASGSDFLFQSTSPVRGTTARIGEQPVYDVISIHVPREGDDYPVLRLVAGG